MKEMIDLAARFGDGRFLMALSKDYFPIDAKSCLREALKRRSVPMFLGFAPYLPLRAVKSICGRAMNYFKRIVTTQVIPAKSGIQDDRQLDPRLRGDDN